MDATNVEYVKDGGVIRYDPAFLAAVDADRYFEYLLTHVRWEARLGAFHRPMPRLTAWFADQVATSLTV